MLWWHGINRQVCTCSLCILASRGPGAIQESLSQHAPHVERWKSSVGDSVRFRQYHRKTAFGQLQSNVLQKESSRTEGHSTKNRWHLLGLWRIYPLLGWPIYPSCHCTDCVQRVSFVWCCLRCHLSSLGQKSCLDLRRAVLLYMLFYFYLFISERERARAWAREGQRGRERIPSRVHAVSTGPDVGLDLTNCESVTWAEVQSQTLNWLSHPGTPEKGCC